MSSSAPSPKSATAPSKKSATPPPPSEPDEGICHCYRLGEREQYLEHFRKWGFVIVAEVLDKDQIEKTIDECWTSSSLLGGYPHIRRDDPKTWDSEFWPGGSRNFIDPKNPCAEVSAWENRLDDRIVSLFETLWATCPGENQGHRLVASADRFGMMRPTVAVDEGADRPDWRTSRNWLHFDQNPWTTPGFFALQGFITLSGGGSKSGAFVTVPGFHDEFETWCQNHPEGSIKGRTAKSIPFVAPLEDPMQARRMKIPVPPGAMVVWDSRLPHENFPNESPDWRIVQYITYKRLPKEHLLARARAWTSCLACGLVPKDFADRFNRAELLRLCFLADDDEESSARLKEALTSASELSPEMLQAAKNWRRARELQQEAVLAEQLQEAATLMKEAIKANPALSSCPKVVGAAEETYLPFWIF